jgi:hypothetical protein
MRTLWKYLRPGRHRPGFIALQRRLVVAALVVAAVVGLGCTGPGIPAEDPKPIPAPGKPVLAPTSTPDPGARPPAVAVP